MNPISGFIIICLLITFGFFVGLLYFLTDYETEKCEVTYMFEYPQYVRVSNIMDKVYPKYELYAYSEGRLTERARNMYFDGVPVLFIPGNAGSHRQVRSLSSVALRKAINSRTTYHLDYFTVYLNNENSALNGALLYDQLNYINGSIYRILELYEKRKNPPKFVTIVGHSMGGVIARHLAALQPDLIPIVLILAGPVKRALLLLDHHMDTFYKTINTNINNSTTIVSLSGGFSDQILTPTLFDLNIDQDNTLNVVTTTIPMSWLQANHVQILWCKQMILAINRALFDSVDLNTGQISENNDYRLRAFKHHLIKHSGIRLRQSKLYEKPVKFDYHKGEWIELMERQKSINLKLGIHEPKYYMVKLIHFNEYEAFTLLGINLDVIDWVFACSANMPTRQYRACAEGQHLTHLSEIAPSVKHKRRILNINLHKLKESNQNLTHLMFRALPTTDPLIFHVDTYAESERTINVKLPKWWSFKQTVILHSTIEKAIHYKLLLPELQHIIQSYVLLLQPYDCSTPYHHAVASLIVPWSNENIHSYSTDSIIQPLFVRLFNSKRVNSSRQSPYIQLTLEPTCRYHVIIKSSFVGMLGQMVRNYSTLLMSFIAAVILMTFKAQLQNIGRTGECSIFFTAITEGAKPYYVLTGFKLLSKLFSLSMFSKYLPEPDWKLLVDDGSDFILLPLLLYVCSVGIAWLLAIMFSISLITLESTVNKVTLKFLAKSISFTFSFSDHLMSVIHKLPFIVSGFLIFLSLTTCGSLALCVGTVFYFLKLTQMSQDFIEQVVWFVVKKFSKKLKHLLFTKKTSTTITKNNNLAITSGRNGELVHKQLDLHHTNEETIQLTGYTEIFFHSSIFFIWCMVTILNLPAVITWAHNFQYSKTLYNDTSLIPGLILSLCAMPLWQLDLPRTDRKWYEQLSQIMWIAAVIVLIYTPISLYRLNYLLSIIIAIVTLHQLFAPFVNNVENNDSNENKNNTETKYDDIKAKMD